MTASVLGPAALAFLVTAALAPVILAGARRLGVLDVPNARSSHAVATPRPGGVAPAVGAALGFATSTALSGPGIGLLVAALAFAVIGLWDDLHSTSPFSRLAAQVACAGVALPWLLVDLRGPLAWKVAFGAAVLVWLVGYVNVFNFMDGINGIAALQAVIGGCAWYALGVVRDEPLVAVGGAVVAAAGLGFVPFNLPVARMFLGDVGSYFLGAWLAALVVIGLRSEIPLEAAVAPAALYVADTGTTLLRRIRRGDRWYEPHREHAYQRFTALGWSHTRTTSVVSAATAACCLLGAASLGAGPAFRMTADAVAVAVLALYVAGPSLLDRSRVVTA